MSKPKGGRSKAAPYVSTHVRIPEPIKDRVEQLKELFFSGQLEYSDSLIAEDHRLANEYRKSLTDLDDKFKPSLPSLEETLEAAKVILSKKRSASVSLAMLLSKLYKCDVKPSDLR